MGTAAFTVYQELQESFIYLSVDFLQIKSIDYINKCIIIHKIFISGVLILRSNSDKIANFLDFRKQIFTLLF